MSHKTPAPGPESQPEDLGHILFAYESSKERQRLLAEYFGEGLANNELCIFVTSDAADKVTKDFLAAGLDIEEAVSEGNLRIFEMEETYLPHSKFVGNYMLMNVVNFIIDAKARGYEGVRTAGEMSWLCDHQEFFDDAMEYEEKITKLRDVSPEFTGLCLYPVREGSGKIVDTALHNHPSYVYDGTIQTNPFYRPDAVTA